MANGQKSDALQVVYGMVVGGLMSTFVGAVVYNVVIVDRRTSTPPFTAAILGLAAAVVLMALGMFLSERISWIGIALLFGSGFTALWSAVLSFAAEQRWMTLLALGVATGLGVVMGWWRFGRARTAPSDSPAPPAPPASVPATSVAAVPTDAAATGEQRE